MCEIPYNWPWNSNCNPNRLKSINRFESGLVKTGTSVGFPNQNIQFLPLEVFQFGISFSSKLWIQSSIYSFESSWQEFHLEHLCILTSSSCSFWPFFESYLKYNWFASKSCKVTPNGQGWQFGLTSPVIGPLRSDAGRKLTLTPQKPELTVLQSRTSDFARLPNSVINTFVHLRRSLFCLINDPTS